MKVSDLMTDAIVTVTQDTQLRKVNKLMHHYHLNSIIVVSEEGKMEGIVTYSDLFRQLLPSYNEIMQDESYWLQPDIIENRIVKLINLPVKNIMTKEPESVSPDMPAVNAGALMNVYKVKQLPVVDNGKLAGIIGYEDITWGLLIKNY